MYEIINIVIVQAIFKKALNLKIYNVLYEIWGKFMITRIIFILLCLFQWGTADKLEDIKTAGIINIGVKYDFKPFGYINDQGRLVGFDIDLSKFIAEKLNVSIKFFQVTSKNRMARLLRDEIDIIVATMTHKQSRDKEIDFSVAYFFDGQAMLVRENEIGKSYKDFKDRKIGAVKGATSGVNFKKLVPSARVIYFSEYPQALRALNRSNIDAITTDYVWCVTQANDSNGTLKVIEEKLSYEPYAIGLAENESNLRDAINNAIQELVREGIYSELHEKWFGFKPKKLPTVWPK